MFSNIKIKSSKNLRSEEISNPKSDPKKKKKSRSRISKLRWKLRDEGTSPESQYIGDNHQEETSNKTLKNKSKLQEEEKAILPESQFAALKIQDPCELKRLKVKKLDGDESRPHNFDFPFRYVTEFSTKCDKKVVRRCEHTEDQCLVCFRDVVDDCGHYQYNARWKTYTLITCCVCKAKGKHWGSQCPQKDNFKPDLSELGSLKIYHVLESFKEMPA